MLEYGKRPRSGRARGGWSIVAAVLVGVALYFAGTIRSAANNWYDDWRFGRAFDRVSRELSFIDGLWVAPPSSSSVNSPADTHLGALLGLSGRYTFPYHAKPNLVLFVRARSETPGAVRALEFACISRTGLEVYTLHRDHRRGTNYQREVGLPTQWPNPWAHVTLLAAHRVGDRIRTSLEIEGGRNEIDWFVNAGSPVAATPLTGWTSAPNWWPDTGGWRLLEGPPPSSEIASPAGTMSIAFLSDDTLAVASASRLELINIARDERKSHALPTSNARPDVLFFSQRATRLFIGGALARAWVIDTINGERNSLGETTQRPHACFIDEKTLWFAGDAELVRVDCETGRQELASILEQSSHGLCAGGSLLASWSGSTRNVHVFNLAGQELASFPQLSEPQLSLSPDGRWLAILSEGSLRLCDLENGSIAWDHKSNNDLTSTESLDLEPPRVQWSADGTRGAVAGRHYAYVWSLRGPRTILRLEHGRTGIAPQAALSPDGRKLAVSCEKSSSVAYWQDVDRSLSPATTPAQ